MHRRFFRSDLAAWHLFAPEVKEVVDEVLLNHQDALEALAWNWSRSSKVFPAVYGKKLPSAEIARAAVAHHLSADEALTVASRERRVTVLEHFLRYNDVSEELIRMLVAKASPATCRELLSLCENLPSDLRPVLALRAGGSTAMQECCYGSPDQFTDEIVLGVLGDENVFSQPSVRSHQLQSMMQVLFSRRPGLTAPALRLEGSAGFVPKIIAAASSSNLTAEAAELVFSLAAGHGASWQIREAIIGLARNPFTPPAVIDKIATGEFKDAHNVRQTLAARKGFLQVSLRDASTPEELAIAIGAVSGSFWDVSLWSLIELFSNPRVPDNTLPDRRSMLSYRTRGAFERTFREELRALGCEPAEVRAPRGPRTPPEPTPELQAALRDVAEILGTDRQAWETFAGLMNEFDGSLAELASIASCV